MSYKDKTLIDNNRNNLDFYKAEVEKVLPSYHQDDYPNLVQFLKDYYEWLEQDDNPSGKIKRLYYSRDTTQVPSNLLEYLEDELLLGTSYFGGFKNKREAIKFSNLLYRSKGSKYSIEQFFRGFYGVDPVVKYPKEDLFRVGPRIDFNQANTNKAGEQIVEDASKIGPESEKRIPNDKLYQVLSILIKSSIPRSRWEDVYRLFAHPAGFFLGSEIQLELINLDWSGQPHNSVADNNGGININIEDVELYVFSLLQLFLEAELSLSPYNETFLISEGDNTQAFIRQKLSATYARNSGYNDRYFDDSDLSTLSIAELVTPKSPTFDDSDTASYINFSNRAFHHSEVAYATLAYAVGSTPATVTLVGEEIKEPKSDLNFVNSIAFGSIKVGDVTHDGNIRSVDALKITNYYQASGNDLSIDEANHISQYIDPYTYHGREFLTPTFDLALDSALDSAL